MVVLGGLAVSYERGTPVFVLGDHRFGVLTQAAHDQAAGLRAEPHPLFALRLPPQGESSLLTTYWSESTLSS